MPPRRVCQQCRSFDAGQYDPGNPQQWYCTACWANRTVAGDVPPPSAPPKRLPPRGVYDGPQPASRSNREDPAGPLANLERLVRMSGVRHRPAHGRQRPMGGGMPAESCTLFDAFVGDSSTTAEVTERAPSLIGRHLRPMLPAALASSHVSLSPRSGAHGGTGRLSAQHQFSLKDRATTELLLSSVDDVVSRIYCVFDEDVTKVILNVLDRITACTTEDQRSRAKAHGVDELIQLVGDEHCALVRALVDRARDVFIKLLEEFCNLDDAEDGRGTSNKGNSCPVPTYGTTVRFVQPKIPKGRHSGNASASLSAAATTTVLAADERWLIHMTRRYREVVAESELDAVLRRDFSVSGTSLPSNMTMVQRADHLRCHLPPPQMKILPVEQRVCVKSTLPPWTHAAFGTVTHLNTLQSAVFEAMFYTTQNMLICAPTGAGKTIVALLAILRQVQDQFIDGVVDKDFKMVFVAPMKALAQEMVENFRKRLSPFQLHVREYTGDMQLTKKEIADTQLIVTTPEKWDVVTRKTSESELVTKTRLIIIDEIHLLNDDRGPVLEAIVARTLRREEMDPSRPVRLVGLSATLPNYKDVARFLHVDLDEGLKVFGAEYRPVPLEQTFIGCHDTTRAKEDTIDRLTFQEVVANLRDGHQVMVFVHSRKQTVGLGKFFMEEALKQHVSHLFGVNDVMDREGLKRGNSLQGRDLSELFRAGICCHHAGLTRYDRNTVEDLFREGHFRVLICTATLAWGVNLPAHTVIIRGTELYDPKRGGFTPISVLDVMQIFGRAGRPQYDTSGHGVIVSDINQISHFLRLIAHALPIESQFMSRLCDHLNAEVHSGTVSTIPEALNWLEYTYLWQRLRVNPLRYGLQVSDVRRDPELKLKRYEIIADAAKALADAGMIRYHSDTGTLDTTDLGRIASHYYIEHESVRTFNEKMRRPDETFVDSMDMGTAMTVVACANEFTQLRVRQEELDELRKLHGLLPKHVQRQRIAGEAADETNVEWKVTTLLKAYISRLTVESHSLAADMNYVSQNVPRVARALFEIEVQRCHPNTTSTFLTLCKCVERRCWANAHPLVQFEYDFTDAVHRHLHEKNPSIQTLQDLDEKEIGTLVHNQRFGSIIRRLVSAFPSLVLDAEVQPITRTILRVKCTITPQFTWDTKYHGGAESFWLFVEDQDNNYIFHHEMLVVRRKDTLRGAAPLVLNLTIPIRPEYEMYCLRIYSDRWLGCEEEFTFSVSHLHLPDDTNPTTKLLPLEPLSRHVIPEAFQSIYSFTQLNAVQTQVFHAMYHTDHNVFLGAPTGSGKTIAAEMAILRILGAHKGGKVVYIAPLKALVKERMQDWTKRFDKMLGHRVVELSGDVTPDIAALAAADLLCTTPEKWDGISRNWQVRSYVTAVQLVIFDEVHMLGNDRGPILEVIVSRMRYIGWHQGKPIRLVGLSTAVANPGDLAAWLGVDKPWCLFNFEPSVRPVPMRVHIAGFPGRHYCPRMATMNKPTYNAIVEKSPDKPVLVFVSSRRQTRLTAMALISFLLAEDNTARFVSLSADELLELTERVSDAYLKHSIQFGIGIHHAGLAETDKQIVEEGFRTGKLQILVATSTLAWGVNFPAHMVVVKGTEFYDGKTKSYVDYPITDVLQMIGRAGRPQFDTEGVAQVLCHEPKKGFYRKFLYEPFPVESALHRQLHVHINAEIVAGTISTRQDAVDYLTWTYLFRRLVKNPSFYGLEDRSPKAVTLFLSSLVRKVLYDLERYGCIEPPPEASDDESVDPNALTYTVLGRLCSYYYLSHVTAKMFDDGIQADMNHESLLTLMCDAAEFSELPVRHNEDKLNLELAGRVPLPIDARNAESPHVKAFLLFQAHFCRAKLPISDYVTDQRSAMDNSVRVVQSMVDVAANNGHLFAALKCMNLLQCVVQGRWWHSPTLLQVPHVTEAMLGDLARVGFHHLADVANATQREVDALMECLKGHQVDAESLRETLYVIRRIPLMDVEVAVRRLEQQSTHKGNNDDNEEEEQPPMFEATVNLTRLSVPAKHVYAPRFSKPKDEQYWIAIGCEHTGELVALKRVNRLFRRTSATLKFEWDDSWVARRGCDVSSRDHTPVAVLTVYVVCDSFIGLDQQYTFSVSPKW